jgi:aspartyl-tRNA(Asn)/glutamyl-tRNA(Gln) amidotransferase subunit A
VSLPCGLADGLPVGFQIMGRLSDERTVLRAAYALERAIGFAERPPLLAELVT